jgi:hypothetical protein
VTITTIDGLDTGTGARFTSFVSTKTAINPTNFGAGQTASFWLASGSPTTGITPTGTTLILSDTTTGAIPFAQQTSPNKSYLVELNVAAVGNLQTIEIHDRLMHISSIANSVSQSITNFDMSTHLATNNLDARKGDANYSDVQWWVEILTNGSTTAVNLTPTVVYNDGTTGNLTAITGLSLQRQTRIFPLNSFIPAADSGKYIRGVTSVISSTTQTGSIAFVATRYRGCVLPDYQGKPFKRGWTDLGMPEIYNQSCLFPIIIATGTTISNINYNGIIAHG